MRSPGASYSEVGHDSKEGPNVCTLLAAAPQAQLAQLGSACVPKILQRSRCAEANPFLIHFLFFHGFMDVFSSFPFLRRSRSTASPLEITLSLGSDDRSSGMRQTNTGRIQVSAPWRNERTQVAFALGGRCPSLYFFLEFFFSKRSFQNIVAPGTGSVCIQVQFFAQLVLVP